MLYLHHPICISAQQTFPTVELEEIREINDNRFYVQPFSSEGIPNAVLRRMGKAVKIGVSSALPIFKKNENLDGIIIGTSNGGMEDCVKFLNQIMDYEEGVLTPTNFVQSTTNAIASQLGFFSANKGYNITHVLRGLSFENALLDAIMRLTEYPKHQYLLGGIEEISDYNNNIDFLANWFKKESCSNLDLYASETNGSLAGEGAAMFIANLKKEGALARVQKVYTLHTKNEKEVGELFSEIQKNHSFDCLLSGENGDSRINSFYNEVEQLLPENKGIIRYKHLCGEYQTSTSFALFLCSQFLSGVSIPSHCIKKSGSIRQPKSILIYNSYHGFQHSFILVNSVD